MATDNDNLAQATLESTPGLQRPTNYTFSRNAWCFLACRLRRQGQKTTRLLNMCGCLALVPQASKNHFAKQTLRDPFGTQPSPDLKKRSGGTLGTMCPSGAYMCRRGRLGWSWTCGLRQNQAPTCWVPCLLCGDVARWHL